VSRSLNVINRLIDFFANGITSDELLDSYQQLKSCQKSQYLYRKSQMLCQIYGG
jgi:hypothetical protein